MSAEQDIRGAEAKLYKAMITNDPAGLDVITSAELAYVHSTAVVESKAEWLAGVKRGLYDYREIKSRDVKIKVSGDLAVMYGMADFFMSTDNRPLETLHLQFTLVWVREGGAWRLLLRQTTRVPG